ncbi:AI-2E family transporter [Sphingobacterium pedocola]|uniref:AI-2E family transporter n=1 Tax=Sphingobacterium pedocola TaxID=2082722 RepID=A0ABR9T5K1_9SPHI|nr:AI-2E family transporter [Sphingobacterium pedocola]MBE8720282.1 AI-2E family transporter [Sphingobacterium pedocola]
MKYKQINNNSINQIMLILIIILICILIFKNLLYYLPGFLGAITLYILFRNIYFKLTTRQKWNKSVTSIFFIILSIVFIVLPLWAIIDYLVPKLTIFLGNQQDIIAKFNTLKIYLSDKPFFKDIDLSNEALLASLQSLTRYIPSVLNSVAEVGINILVALFVLYFMQVHAKRMETYIYSAIPLSPKSKKEIWAEVKLMVKSNAIGIPILGLCQGVVAMIGYWFFGIENYILWGILTGVSSIIPVFGTMTVYVPICVITLASGQTANAIGLSVYCFLLVGGIDNILRFTILKQLGNVPPLITVFGVLLGLNMFGMLGLIFGPLILSSVGLLIRVYANEFGRSYVAEKELSE